MRRIIINRIIKKNNRIEFEYTQSGLDNYIDASVIPFYEYDCNIESVPDSIAIIPFVANIIPLSFVLDVTIEMPCIDKSFYNCIDAYRNGYSKMIPMLNFAGAFIADRIEDNTYEPQKNCLLFSGGIDATSSLAVNADVLDDCITIWGSDIAADNIDGWKKMSSAVHDTVQKFGKRWIVIKSNFRVYINEHTLGMEIKKTKDNWWHALQHGIALLGQIAPLAYINKYKTIYIASSFTKDFNPICASDPRTDNCFKCASAYTVHDGYEFNRCQKVINIEKKRQQLNTTFDVHVCWESATGKNCGHCEKCFRSYLNCRAVNCDGEKLGIVPSVNMSQIRDFYLHKFEFRDSNIYAYNMIQQTIKNTYGEKVPSDLKWLLKLNVKKVNHSFYWFLKKSFRRARSVFKRCKSILKSSFVRETKKK